MSRDLLLDAPDRPTARRATGMIRYVSSSAEHGIRTTHHKFWKQALSGRRLLYIVVLWAVLKQPRARSCSQPQISISDPEFDLASETACETTGLKYPLPITVTGNQQSLVRLTIPSRQSPDVGQVEMRAESFKLRIVDATE